MHEYRFDWICGVEFLLCFSLEDPCSEVYCRGLFYYRVVAGTVHILRNNGFEPR